MNMAEDGNFDQFDDQVNELQLKRLKAKIISKIYLNNVINKESATRTISKTTQTSQYSYSDCKI